MEKTSTRLIISLTLAAVPIALYAFSDGPPLRRTGAAVDGGLDCTACHRSFAPANSDARGRVVIEAAAYTPGVAQTLRVMVEHPEGNRWGFQLIAREARNELQQAGTFTASSTVRVACDPSGLAPCNGAREFASHYRVSTQLGTPERGVWEIQWTPPSTDVGEVVFYAAGNAANGNNANTLDSIYTTSLRISAACSLNRRPTISRVANAASFGTSYSLNSMVTIGGTGYLEAGQRRLITGEDIAGGRFPTELACLAVEIDGRRAPLTYLDSTSINAQIPSTNSLGPVEVRVIANPGRPNELRSEPARVTLEAYSPTFLTFLPSLSIAAQVSGTPTFVGTLGGMRPARPGELVTLYGIGFGPTEPFYQAGEITLGAAPIRDPLTVIIGGVALGAADIQYAGLAGNALSALYQFNVRVPESAPDGEVPVTIRIGGLETQRGAFIPVRRQ